MEEKGEMKNNADNYFQKLLNQHPSKDVNLDLIYRV